MKIEAAHTTLSRWWKQKGDAPIAANMAEVALHEIERRYRISLPKDFRLYLLQGAPAEDFWDKGDIIWWSPERIKSIPDEYENPIDDDRIASRGHSYLFFADYMIWFWAWAICCDDGEDRGKVALIGGHPDRIVAGSFTEFVEAYVKDPLFAVA